MKRRTAVVAGSVTVVAVAQDEIGLNEFVVW